MEKKLVHNPGIVSRWDGRWVGGSVGRSVNLIWPHKITEGRRERGGRREERCTQHDPAIAGETEAASAVLSSFAAGQARVG